MAFGLPAVGPKHGAPTEFIRQREHSLFVDPADSADVAEALTQLLAPVEDARRVGRPRASG